MGRRKREPKDDIPKIGHNSGHLGDDDRRKLRSYVGEVERIGEQIDELRAEQKLIYDSAKDSNFDTKAIRALVRERKVDRAKREAFERVCDAYRLALGMLADTPLGRAAVEHDPKVRKAVEKLGTPAELTDEERAKGMTAAFVDAKGNRMTVGFRDTDTPPTAELPRPDTSDAPFHPPAAA